MTTSTRTILTAAMIATPNYFAGVGAFARLRSPDYFPSCFLNNYYYNKRSFFSTTTTPSTDDILRLNNISPNTVITPTYVY